AGTTPTARASGRARLPRTHPGRPIARRPPSRDDHPVWPFVRIQYMSFAMALDSTAPLIALEFPPGPTGALNGAASRMNGSRWIQEMTWQEIQAYLEEECIAIVPVGATEQHGPHM